MKHRLTRRFIGLYCAFLLMMTGGMGAFARKPKVPAVFVDDLRVENLTNPMGLDVRQPRLSWKIRSAEKNVMQQSYRILVASTPEKLAEDKGDIWDSGIVSDEQSVWVPYAGKELKDNQRCYWKVQLGTTVGETDWSEPASWSMGLYIENHWRGRWIGLDKAMPWESENQ